MKRKRILIFLIKTFGLFSKRLKFIDTEAHLSITRLRNLQRKQEAGQDVKQKYATVNVCLIVKLGNAQLPIFYRLMRRSFLINNQKKEKKKKNYSSIYLISLKSASIKIKRIQVFFDIKLYVLQTASFFLTFNFALQPANFAYIMKYTERLM